MLFKREQVIVTKDIQSCGIWTWLSQSTDKFTSKTQHVPSMMHFKANLMLAG